MDLLARWFESEQNISGFVIIVLALGALILSIALRRCIQERNRILKQLDQLQRKIGQQNAIEGNSGKMQLRLRKHQSQKQ